MCDKRNNKLNSRQQHEMILSRIQIFNLTETEIETKHTQKNAKYLHRFRCHSQLAIDRSINDVPWYLRTWKMFVNVSIWKKEERTIFGALRVRNRQTIDNLFTCLKTSVDIAFQGASHSEQIFKL